MNNDFIQLKARQSDACYNSYNQIEHSVIFTEHKWTKKQTIEPRKTQLIIKQINAVSIYNLKSSIYYIICYVSPSWKGNLNLFPNVLGNLQRKLLFFPINSHVSFFPYEVYARQKEMIFPLAS